MDKAEKVKKILLIRPKCWGADTAMPTGLMSVASYLRRYGYRVDLRDLTHQSADFAEAIRSGEYGIVGISMLSYARTQPYRLIQDVKAINPKVKVVVGGIHGTSVPDLLIEHFPIDAVVMGEGEVTMKQLADLWLLEEGDLKEIPGVYTKEHGKGKVRSLIESLDSLPPLDYADINFDWYHSGMVRNRPNTVVNGVLFRDAKFANLSFSRGCMGRCSFCNAFVHWKGEVRTRGSDAVFSEIEQLYRMGRNLFYFNDDAFGQDRQSLLDLCQAIHYCGMKVAWFADARVDCFDEELLYWCAKAGCFCLSFGVESGSQKILDKMGKGIKVNQIRQTFALAKKAGIHPYALLMIGNQGETDRTIQETYDLMMEVAPDIWSALTSVLVFPATRYEQVMVMKHRFDRKYWVIQSDGAPTFLDGFTERDLKRWNEKIRSLPRSW